MTLLHTVQIITMMMMPTTDFNEEVKHMLSMSRYLEWLWRKTCDGSNHTWARPHFRDCSLTMMVAKEMYSSATIKSMKSHPMEVFWMGHELLPLGAAGIQHARHFMDRVAKIHHDLDLALTVPIDVLFDWASSYGFFSNCAAWGWGFDYWGHKIIHVPTWLFPTKACEVELAIGQSG